MKLFARVTCIFIGTLFMLIGVYGTASADGVIPWEGQGSDNLPCPQGGLWIVQAPYATTVTAWVNNIPYPMEQQGGGNSAWHALSGPLPVDTTAYATYTGDVSGNTGMELSHCEGELPTATPTVHPSDTPTDTPETPSATPTDTNTPVFTPTDTGTPSPTSTHTAGPSPTPTRTAQPSITNTPGSSPTPTKTLIPTVTITAGPSPTVTATPPEKNTGAVSGGGPIIYLLFGLLGVTLILLGIFFPGIKAKVFVSK